MSIPVYSSANMQKWDQYSIEHEPISSLELMERAASIAAKSILGRNLFEKAAIFCGPGNNGGDGLVIARLLHHAGKKVKVYHLKFGEHSADFLSNLKRLPADIEVFQLDEKNHPITITADLVIDAVFGSGLNREVSGWIGEVIQQMNDMEAIKIAIDMPSGLFAENNAALSKQAQIFEANETLSFMSPKMPFFFESYEAYVGHFRILDIGLDAGFESHPIAHYILPEDIHIQARKTHDHKGKNGYLTLIGGIGNMTGAIVISVKAAMRSGVGYVAAVSNKNARISLNTVIPEAIWQNAKRFERSDKTTAIAIGPGLGVTDLSFALLGSALNAKVPLVLDADAINLLAEHPNLLDHLPKGAILTPHIGELKRLIGTYESEEELLEKQIEFSKTHEIFIIQKGPFSKLTTPNGACFINSSGNPGMATAGMGDALTGIIGSFLAQGYLPETAAINGMFLHGYAADEHLKNVGEIGMLASDIIKELPTAINKFIRK